MGIHYERNGRFVIELDKEDLLYDMGGDVISEIDGDLNDFDFSDIEDYVESQGYTIVDSKDYDNLLDRIDADDTQELIEAIEYHGYTVRKSNNRIDELLDYIEKNKLNNIQIDDLLDKILL